MTSKKSNDPSISKMESEDNIVPFFRRPKKKPLEFSMMYMGGEHKGPAPPEFCRTCGRTMTVYVQRSGFDPVTGEQQFDTYAECPAPWYLQLWQDHDRCVADKYHNWPYL